MDAAGVILLPITWSVREPPGLPAIVNPVSVSPFTPLGLPAIMSPVNVPSTLPFSSTMNCRRQPGAPLADTAAASSGVFCTIWEGGKRGWQVLKCVERPRAPSALNHGLIVSPDYNPFLLKTRRGTCSSSAAAFRRMAGVILSVSACTAAWATPVLATYMRRYRGAGKGAE